MKTAIAEDKTRKISDRDHNEHVANGIHKHKSTQVAPTGMMQPFGDALMELLFARQKTLEKELTKILGKPFYSDIGFILYHGDCTEFLERLYNNKVHINLTLTSPPYNIGKEYERLLPIEEYSKWCGKWMKQIYNITDPGGAFWLNLGYLEVEGSGLCVPIPYLLWNKSPFFLLQEIVWQYGAGVTTKRRLSPRNEKWLFYVKNPDNYIFNLDDIRDPNVKYPNQKKNGKYRCNPFGKNPSDVWRFPKVTTGDNRSSKERTGHPAQFPLSVVERIIKVSSNRVDVVLDPFAGSCSAGIAAYGLGRMFLGFEINQAYCQMAIQRFEAFKDARMNFQRQGKLF